jgi:hypothetical protein
MLVTNNIWSKYNAVEDSFGNIVMVSASAWESALYFAQSI